MLAPDWWDYTTLDDAILNDAARLTPEDMLGLSRKGFAVKFYTEDGNWDLAGNNTLTCPDIGLHK